MIDIPTPTLAAVVTGATGAIGTQIALRLARRHYPLWLGCRSQDKAEQLIERCKATGAPNANFLPLDLTSEASVRNAAQIIRESGQLMAGLINNAGVMNRHWHTDEHGRELTMLVNYWHTRLFTELVLPLIKDGGAVVSTTSLTRFWPGSNPENLQVAEKEFSQLGAYGQSKKALTGWMRALASSAEGRRLRINCADPGVVSTSMITMDRWYDPLADLLFRPIIRTPRQGSDPAFRAWDALDSGHIYCRFLTHRL